MPAYWVVTPLGWTNHPIATATLSEALGTSFVVTARCPTGARASSTVALPLTGTDQPVSPIAGMASLVFGV